MIFRVGAVIAALSLAGCASLKSSDDVPAGDLIAGRMSVQVSATDLEPARNVSAAFELSGTPERGRLDLNNPIGSTMARARWEPGLVALDTPQGQSRHPTLEDMTRTAIGEALPVPALFDWLRGRPWPGADSTPVEPPDPAGFRQLGWTVDLSRFDDARLIARREATPVITVNVKLDRP